MFVEAYVVLARSKTVSSENVVIESQLAVEQIVYCFIMLPSDLMTGEIKTL